MRSIFKGYYAPDAQELENLWSEGTIVLDTNTLLNFFRYTPSTRDEFLRVLESLKASLWIPHQVGLEFHSRRLDVISGTSEAFTKVKASIDTAKSTVTKTLNEFKHHPSLNRTEVTKELEELFRVFSERIDEQHRSHEAWIAGAGDPEQTFARISELFSGRVGEGFTPEEHDAIRIEGEHRYEHKIPPGYKDSGKSNGNQYGDLVIWKEILRQGEFKKQPLIFVTDDAKEDWWRIDRGKTQGPRVELVDEYWSASEQRIHLYEPLQFLKHAKVRTRIPVSDDSLEEVEEVSNASERALRVLRERRESLIAQRENQIRNLDRRRRYSLEPGKRELLMAELEALDHEEKNLELQREVSHAETETLLHRLRGGGELGQKEEDFRRASVQAEHQNDLARRLELVAQRRADLRRQFPRDPRGDDRMADLSARRLRALEGELREVSLALDELEG